MSIKIFPLPDDHNDQQTIHPPGGEFVSNNTIHVPETHLKVWQEIVDLAAELIDVPSGLIVQVCDEEYTILLSSNSSDNPFPRGLKAPKEDMVYCARVVKSHQQLIVPNFHKDPSRSPRLDHDQVMNAYFGLPLYWPSGEMFGAICVLDNKENNFTLRQQKLLKKLQQTILSDLALITRMKELEMTKMALCELNKNLAEKSLILKHQAMELQEAKEFAENASEMKSTFLTNMSHELRTPLNAILGFSQLMKESKKHPLNDKQKVFVDRIHESGDHLLNLINDILDLSKIETGKDVLSLKKISVSVLFDECHILMVPMAEQFKISLDFQMPEEDLFLFCDFKRCKQILLNLCSNGIKYNKENGHLIVWANRKGDKAIRLTVKDTGIGIPEDRMEELFEPFSRLGAESSEIEGTGIGMAITKKLIENMNGELNFTSEVGSGSEFYVDLPKG